MRENICHKVANESLFVGFAVILLTVITTLTLSALYPSIIVLFTLRAAYDLSRCENKLVVSKRNSGAHHILQPIKV